MAYTRRKPKSRKTHRRKIGKRTSFRGRKTRYGGMGFFTTSKPALNPAKAGVGINLEDLLKDITRIKQVNSQEQLIKVNTYIIGVLRETLGYETYKEDKPLIDYTLLKTTDMNGKIKGILDQLNAIYKPSSFYTSRKAVSPEPLSGEKLKEKLKVILLELLGYLHSDAVVASSQQGSPESSRNSQNSTRNSQNSTRNSQNTPNSKNSKNSRVNGEETDKPATEEEVASAIETPAAEVKPPATEEVAVEPPPEAAAILEQSTTEEAASTGSESAAKIKNGTFVNTDEVKGGRRKRSSKVRQRNRH